MKANLTGRARFAVLAAALLLASPARAAGLQPAGFTTTGSGVTTEVLSDLTTVVKFTAAGTITLDQDTTARILAVGGGGGGGGDCAPGGGGGGVIDRTGVTLRAGLYSVSVGSGGIGGNTTGVKGSNGGNTSLQRDGAGEPMLLAYGGGGAGAWNNGAGLDGGCGGGGWSHPGQGVEGQGYPATAQEGDAPGGGGGAGGSPAAVNIGRGNGTQRQADGGPGRASDITGTTEYYGPGGGSGGFNGLAGWGGDQSTLATEGWIWGCGWNHSSAMTDEQMVAAGLKQQGRDGYGGGGGGSSNTHYAGGNGGSGVLILRIDPVQAAPEPKITVSVETTGPNPAVKVFVASVGADADTTGVFYQTALAAAGLDAAATNVAAAAATPGQTVSIPLSSYPAGLTYFVRVVAKNDQDVFSTPSETSFRLPDLPVGAAAEGGDKVVQLSGASHDIVHTFTRSGTFTLSAPATVRYLVVGGGGAGGQTQNNNSGGGGGAGGFLAGTTNLTAGTYTITVGAGGQTLGAGGSPSSISIAAGAGGVQNLITALGGGGGGGGAANGGAGASGGGGGSSTGTTTGGAGTAGQGFGGADGGVGTNWVENSYTETTGGRVTGLDTMAGGGGGAGGPGECGNVDSHNNCNGAQYGGYRRDYHGGNGGPGLPSDITGEEVWYAGGGGGGVWHDETYVAWGGAGGKGGGGMGDWSLLPQADIDGKPNSGGGGGGQGRGNGRADPIYWGKGGSGVVILRYAPAGDAVGLDPVETALGATSATVTTWTAGAGVAEEVRWGTDPANLASTAAVSGGTATLSPLVPGTTYYAQAAGGGLSGRVVEFLARPWPRFYSDDAQPVMVGTSDYLVTFTQGGAFTLPAPVTVRALLVGGGGGGGRNAGAGGGAGGMLEVSNVVLAAGSYTVRIGAGGAASAVASQTGSKGGDTVLLRDGEPVLRAYGGGGGQSWECYGEAALATSTGGSGGGNTRQDKPGTYVDPAQGNPGGPSIHPDRGDWDGNPGGGGGAGGRGLTLVRWPQDSNRHNGDGGPGRASDITGESVVYAAGGGAAWSGQWSDALAGSGGREGSGHGVRKNATAQSGDEDGLPNTGDGGGGGSSGVAGGAGGSGILVLRFARDPDAPGLADAALVENILRLDGSVVCQESGARVTYRFAGPGEDVETAAPVVLAESSTAGATLSFTKTGLVGNAIYTVLFEATKNGHAALPVKLTASPFLADPGFATTSPGHAKTRVGADEVHKFLQSGTFTLASRRRARLLAVGGGGGAGWGSQYGGAGGGAGGLVELPGVLLQAGEYRYEIGAGGEPGKTDASKGGNGGNTTLYWIDPETRDEKVVARAAGGGGSGATNDGCRDGLDGGSGGGGVLRDLSHLGKGGKGIAGQGHDGGGWTSAPESIAGSSGGGGAGAPGETGTATKGGDGGDGLPSDITGEEVWYAGGGGASARNNNADVRTVGRGGKGGGGHGADYGDYTTDPGRDGADGLGGGGGGGLAWFIQGGPHRWHNCFGGRGGSGTLILRFAAAPEDEPVLAGVTATLKDATTATFSGTVEWAGDGASTADVRLTKGGMVLVAAQGLATGDDFTFDVPVTPGATFDWSLSLRNNLGETSESVSGSIEVPADDPVAIATTGDPELRAVGTDTVAIFTNTAAAGSFTVPAGGAWVEMLAVGGGGAGGAYWDNHGGAGGGAGGFVHEPARFLEEGVYTVTVGAGGKGREDATWNGNWGPGNPGSASTVQLGGADVVRALGGSGGGSRYSGNCTNVGEYAAVASTGGAMPMNTSNIGYVSIHAQPGTPSQGNHGGAGLRATITNSSGSGTYLFAGGGGGAGAPGGDGDPVSQTFGDGGDGLPCFITGEEVWYAGGGGCGSAYKAPGSLVAAATKGGRGGGGYGQRAKAGTDPDNRGVNGLGGGGGGGGYASGNWDNPDSAAVGHSGGSGTVVVRWRSIADSTILVVCDEPVGGFRRGTFSGTVASAGGAGARVDVEIGVSRAGSATTNWTTVARGLAAGDTFSAAIDDNLWDNLEYLAAWRASNGFASATGDAGSFRTYAGGYLVPDPGSTGATITQIGQDKVYTYTNSDAAGTFVVLLPGYARVLAVGGGGAGGWPHAGGGGGGGVIEEELVWFDAGTYTVTVGAGGAPSSGNSARGGAGGDTVVAFGGEERWRALGGGGGGSGNDNSANAGGNGGSGGGGGGWRNGRYAGKTLDPAQGHDGASGLSYQNSWDAFSGGGGGGAGGPGVPALEDHTVPGAGGPGRVSDISGSAQQYGAGGGAGGPYNNRALGGEGGDGIGGHGRRRDEAYWTGDEAGRAGFGGGGGAGAPNGPNDNDNSFNRRPGAPGGCGTVVIRFASSAPSGGRPDAAVVEAVPSDTDPTAARVTVFVRSLGNKASATLELVYGASREALSLTNEVGTVSAVGTVEALLPGLEPGGTYYIAAAIRSKAGEGPATRAVEVTLPPVNAEPGAAGLWQTTWGASTAPSDAEIWAQASVSNVVAGTIAAIGKGDAVDPLTGDSYAWASAPYLFLYRGFAFLKGGTTYTFGSRMDDTVRLTIGGETILDLEANPSHTAFAEFTAPHTGWYPVAVRLGNAAGGLSTHGPDGDGTSSWASFALAYNTTGSRAMIPESDWTVLLDPGDGSLLRPDDPGLRYADVSAGAVSGGSLSLSASVAPGDADVEAYLCYGSAWGGNDPFDWDEAADLGEVAAADAATSLGSRTVPGWGSAAKVAAVALVHPDGTVTWSDPVTYAGTSLLSLSAAATDWSRGDRLEVSFTAEGGAAPYRAELYIGPAAGKTTIRAAAATGLAAGTHTLAADGLVPGTTYHWKVVVTDASGASVASDDSAYVEMPSAADYLNEALGISWSVDQNTATLVGGLKTLGAGDNWALLNVYEDPYLRWSDTRNFRGNTTNAGDRVLLAETGLFSIEREFPWESQIGFNWVVSNSNGSAVWTTSRMPNWDGNSAADRGIFWVGDRETYTWAGGEGDYDDEAMWTPDPAMEGRGRRGFPVTGSYFTFPAGAHVVRIPAAGSKTENGVPVYRPVSFDVPDGAKVRFEATAESARLNLVAINPPNRSRAVSFGSGAELVVSGAKGTWKPRNGNETTLYFGAPDTLLEFTDGAEIEIGHNVGQWAVDSWNNGSQEGRRFVFSKGAKVTFGGMVRLSGPQEFVIEDAQVVMGARSEQDYNRIHLALTDGGRFVFRGEHPLLRANNRIAAETSTNPKGAELQFFDFEVPVGGFAEAPLQTREGNTTYALGVGGGTTYRLAMRVPTNSPAATAKGVLEQPLIRWPAGKTDSVVIDRAYLPHPDTDEWYETKDATGAFTGWGVRLVGRPDIEDPQVVAAQVDRLVTGAADISFYGIPGTNAASATFAVAIARTDAAGTPTATLSPSGAVTAGTRFTVAATGLEDGGSYLLTITGTDNGGRTCVETFAFDALRDYGEGETSSPGATETALGAETVWTFSDAETPGSLTVTRAGWARILAVGGGGSGGGGGWGGYRAGGGGGGGQVVETTAFLMPGVYTAVVGAGGAEVTSETVGRNGGDTMLLYGTNCIVAASGGGGGGSRWWTGSVYNAIGKDGANGGGSGGTEEKDGNNNCVSGGGQPTVADGFPGGDTTAKYANWNDVRPGGGGGGAGAAGGNAFVDADGWYRGGYGGAGRASDVSGSSVLYGGGGGGGGGGLAFYGGGYGGAGGGGEGRSWELQSEFSRLGARGADGLGGGGGGGAGAGGGNDGRFAVADRYSNGAPGGSGVVIVRMRTRTAETNAPQVAVAARTPFAGGLDLSVLVQSLGRGADSAQLLLAFDKAEDHDAAAGFSRTNALFAVSAPGATNFAAHGLKPGTEYVAALVATNALGGAGSFDLGSFRTPVEYHADVDSGLDGAGVWSLAGWNGSDYGLSDNLLRASRGTTVAYGTRQTGNGWGPWGVGDAKDAGLMNDGTNGGGEGYASVHQVIFSLPEAAAIRSFRLHSQWDGDEWDRIAVKAIDVRSAPSEDWREIPSSGYVSDRVPDAGQSATFEATGNDWLARDVRQVRVRFAASARRDGTIYKEIEAFGEPEATAPGLHARAGAGRALAPSSAILSPNAFLGTVTAAAGEPAFSDVVAVWGAAYAGEDTNAWAGARSIGAMGEAATTLSATISAADLGDAAYVRYCGVGADGSVSWSDSVYLPDLEVRTDVPPVVVFGTASSAGTTADLSATVVSAGSLATAQQVDVVLQYTLDPDGFAEGVPFETFAFANGAPVGPLAPVRVSTLRPNRRYYARFVAENDMHQVGTNDVFSFDTSSGVFGDGVAGSGLLQQKCTGVSNAGNIAGTRTMAWDETKAENVEGVLAAYSTGSFSSPRFGGSYKWDNDSGFIYRGFIRLEGGVEYTMVSFVDDTCEVTIDGVVVLTQASYAQSAFVRVVKEKTGWYPITIIMSNGNGGAGGVDSFGLGWNTTGREARNATDMNKFLDPGDGSFLRPTAVRALDISRAVISGGSVDLSAVAGAGNPVGTVWAVWGATDLGTNAAPAGWPGRVTIGTAGKDAGRFGGALPISDPSATPVVRVAIVPSGGGEILWSSPVLLDADDPTIGPVAAVADGDRLAVAGTMASLGTGAGFSLELLWGYAADLSDAQRTNLVVDAQGAFAGTVPVLPSTNGWWRLVARTAGDGVDATIPAAFETKGGSVLDNVASATVAHHTVTARGTLDVLGAGTTTAAVWQSADGETGWEPVAGSSQILPVEGPFALEAVIPGDPHTVHWKIVAVNVAPGGAAWTNETPVYTIATTDAATYTWKVEATEGSWTNAACWTPSGVPDLGDCLGYPAYAESTALFLDGTEAVIAVPAGTFRFNHMDLNVNRLDVRFVGEGASSTTLYGNVWGAGDSSRWTAWTAVFDNLTLREENTIQMGNDRCENARLAFENGAVGSFSGWQDIRGTNSWLVAKGGSRIEWRNGDGIIVYGWNAGVELEDSAATMPQFYYERKGAAGPQGLLLSGEDARFRATSYFRTYSESEDPMNGDLTISFRVPLAGWKGKGDTPLYASYGAGTDETKPFAYRSTALARKVVLSVDGHSPLLQSGRSRTWEKGNAVQLVEWRAGIDAKNVVLEQRKGVRMYYTYGFPQIRITPNSPDEVPTGVAADIVGLAGTILIFR